MTTDTVDRTEEKPASRELVFENVGSDKENVSLLINDRAAQGVKPINGQPVYKIPLYQATARENKDDKADVELVHIYPKRHAHADALITDHEYCLREGYLYIFVDGYLWRELKVTNDEKNTVAFFSDVNLAYQKGELTWKAKKGQREATGEQLKSILVPYKLAGKECEVQIAYSETQWAWKQIQAFGGINPQDPRLNYGDSIKTEEADTAEAAERRAARMQTLDELGGYQQGYSHQKHPKHLVLQFANQDQIYVPIIKDELGRARSGSAEIIKLRKAIDLLAVESALGQSLNPSNAHIPEPTPQQVGKFAIAQTIQSNFIAFPNHVKDKIKTNGKESVSAQEKELASNYQEWSDKKLVKQDLRLYLKTAEAFQAADYINDLKTQLFEILTEEQENGSFYQAVKDYAYYHNTRRLSLYEAIMDVIAPLKDSTAELVKNKVITTADKNKLKEIGQEDMGQACVLKVLGAHPDDKNNPDNVLALTKLCMPKAIGEGLKEYQSYREPNEPYNVDFDIDEFKYLNNNIDNDLELGFQVARRAFHVLWGFINITFEVPTAMFVMGDAKGDVGLTYTKRVEEQVKLQQKSTNIDAEIKTLEKEIELKETEINSIEEHKKSMQAEAIASGLDPKNIDTQLEEVLKQRQQALNSLKREMRTAKTNHTQVKALISNLINAGEDLLEYGKNVRIRNVAMSSPVYLRLVHLMDIVSDGLIKEIDIDLNDYFKGNIPNGDLPLNFLDKANSAEQRIKQFTSATMGAGNDVNNITGTPTAWLKVAEGQSIEANLNNLWNLDGSMNEMERMITEQLLNTEQEQQRITRKMLVINGKMVDELTEINIDKKRKLTDKEVEKVKADWESNVFKEHTDSLENIKRFKNISLNTFNNAFNGLLPMMAIFEGVNFYRAYQNDGVSALNKTSAALDLADIMMNIARSLVTKKYGLPSIEQIKTLVLTKNTPTSALGKTYLTGRLSSLGLKAIFVITTDVITFVAGAVSAYCAYLDFEKALGAGRTQLAVAYGLMTFGFALMAAAPILAFVVSAAVVGMIFIAGLIIIILVAALLFIFSDTEIEAWLRSCPWGRNKYKAYDANNASRRADQWQQRPDLCLLDLFNILYRPNGHINVSPLTETLQISVQAPAVSEQNGADIQLSWRKGLVRDKQEFKVLALKQLEQLKGEWLMYPNRTGWQLTCTFGALAKVLGVKKTDNIELQLNITTYPLGKGAKVLEGFETLYSLPIEYYKQGESASWYNIFADDTRTETHKPSSVQINRQTYLDKAIYDMQSSFIMTI